MKVTAGLLGALSLLNLLLIAPVWAQEPDLQVSGNIGQGATDLAIEDLQAIGVSEVRTTTPWTTGVKTFKGVLARDLMAYLQATGDVVTAAAVNDYSAVIPLSDFSRYDVLIAWEMEGRRLSLRDKGPLWIVYPLDQNPEVGKKEVQGRWVWQLNRLEVQ